MITPPTAPLGRWGTPAAPPEFTQAIAEFLRDRAGPPGAVGQSPSVADLLPGGSRLTADQLAALDGAVGRAAVSVDPADRLAHSVGASLTDYLRVRGDSPIAATDAVVRPAGREQVNDLLRVCSEADIEVIPVGGATSVVGGMSPVAGGDRPQVTITFDLMAEVISVNRVDRTVTVQPGITGPMLERFLAVRGLTLGHLPQSWERATLGGYVATRSAGQASSGYGRSDEMVESMVVATPTGELSLGVVARSAAGPDLRQLFIGSEGALGLITELTLRVRSVPGHSRYEGLMFPDFESGQAAFRELAQSRLQPTVLRLSDDSETETTLKMSGPGGAAGAAFRRYLAARGVAGGCLGILGWEGSSQRVLNARRSAAWRILHRHGAVKLGNSVGKAWRKHRFEGPFLRDVLLDHGYLVETVETAAHFSRVGQLKESVTTALREVLEEGDRKPLVMCHISHVYETGCSLYFTVVVPAGSDPIAQWRAAKAAATDAMVANGGTITHHHAVGQDHRPWLDREIGAEGVAVLRAVKQHVDPNGIMNPGKLIPPA